MGILTDSLIPIIVFIIVISGFTFIVGDLNTNYQTSYTDTQLANSQYMNDITNVTTDITNQLSAKNLAEATSSNNLVAQVISGGQLVTGLFTVIITDIPKLANIIITSALSGLGIDWLLPYIILIFFIIVIAAGVKFVLGREL